jgi:ATP-dependent Lon protease
VKEKVLGAYRAGIREILLPRDNEAHLDDLPREVRDQMKFHPVADLGEVLALSLRGASLQEGRVVFPQTDGARQNPAGPAQARA